MKRNSLETMNVSKTRSPITFLLGGRTAQILRVIYVSYSSRAKDMVADIDLVKETVTVYDQTETRSHVSSFVGHNWSMADFRKMQTSGCDLSIIRHGEEVVDKKLSETDEKDDLYFQYYSLLLHIQSVNYNYVYFDAIEINAKDIVDKINQMYHQDFLDTTGHNRKNCYCGITNDIDRRMEEHRKNDFLIWNNKVYAFVCNNRKVAIEVEKSLAENYRITKDDKGDESSAAGNGAKEDSVIVYLLKPCDK